MLVHPPQRRRDAFALRVEGDPVTVIRVPVTHDDPVARKFLSVLAQDIEQRPEALEPVTAEFAARMQTLVKGNKVDLDEPIDGDVDL